MITLDSNDAQQARLLDEIECEFQIEKELKLITQLNAELVLDENGFCYRYAKNTLDNGTHVYLVVGNGETVALAMTDFYHNFYNNKNKPS